MNTRVELKSLLITIAITGCWIFSSYIHEHISDQSYFYTSVWNKGYFKIQENEVTNVRKAAFSESLDRLEKSFYYQPIVWNDFDGNGRWDQLELYNYPIPMVSGKCVFTTSYEQWELDYDKSVDCVHSLTDTNYYDLQDLRDQGMVNREKSFYPFWFIKYFTETPI